MVNANFFYVPDKLDNKADVKHLVFTIIIIGLILFVFFAIISYTSEFPISAYLSLYAVSWLSVAVVILIKHFNNRVVLNPEIVLELIKSCGNTPKFKDTILNIIQVQEKITKSDLLRIICVLQKELSELYVKNYQNLIGINKDQEIEIIAKGEAEVAIYTESIAVLEDALWKINSRKD